MITANTARGGIGSLLAFGLVWAALAALGTLALTMRLGARFFGPKTALKRPA